MQHQVPCFLSYIFTLLVKREPSLNPTFCPLHTCTCTCTNGSACRELQTIWTGPTLSSWTLTHIIFPWFIHLIFFFHLYCRTILDCLLDSNFSSPTPFVTIPLISLKNIHQYVVKTRSPFTTCPFPSYFPALHSNHIETFHCALCPVPCSFSRTLL